MPGMHRFVSSLLRILGFTVAVFAGRGFAALETEPPQSAQQMQARDALNQGVQAFKNGQTDGAIRQFERAKDLDPNLLNARLYLATAYASLYIPGTPSEENRANGQRAIDEFAGVLVRDTNNLGAIDGMASVLFQMAGTPFNPEGLWQSKTYHLRHLGIRPNDPEPYYWIGVIDWTLAFHANGELRQKYNAGRKPALPDSDPLPSEVRGQYASKYGPLIDEGIESLAKAISLRPDNDDAMAYLNLLYRRKADTVASLADREQLDLMADQLLDQVKEIKQRRIQQANPQQPQEP
jgi:tetratricopeptide (TPR) repeat protein